VEPDRAAVEPDRTATGPDRAAVEPDRAAVELELMAAGAALALAVLADRANQEAAHDQAHQEDLAIDIAEAGRHRRELADLDATLTEPATTSAGTTVGNDEGTGWDD
jgi:hypothetical protein